MNKSAAVWQTLQKHRLIALLNPKRPDECVQVYEALAPMGVVLEVALRGEAAIRSIRAVLEKHPDALILAGTVLTREQAEKVLAAGVAGVVSADYVPAVVDACLAKDVMCIPGGLADAGKQLVHKAEHYGQSLEKLREQRPWQWVYKVFPAMANPEATLATANAWRAVYPGLALVYTGGVTLKNVGQLAAADPDGLFCGSALTRFADEPIRMMDEATRWLDAIADGRMARGGSASSRQNADANVIASGEEQTFSGVKLSDALTAGRKAKGGPTKSVVTFGEIMMRLSPPAGRRFRQASSLEVAYGGSEANVAVSLALWGMTSRFVTCIPAHDIGQSAVDTLRSFGVDTSAIFRGGKRLGIYFLEYGASQRPSRVIYDRAGSAIATIEPGSVDWEAAFAGADWFHWTGITPALSEGTAAVTAEAVFAAKRAGLTVSVDLNYRSKLWSKERAQAVMTPLMEFVDVVIANEEDAADVFDIAAEDARPDLGELDVVGYEGVARSLVDRFDLRAAAITLRQSHSASDNTWSACLWDGEEFSLSRSYPIHLVDRVGGGDAFSAGLIYGLLDGQSNHEALEYAVAASCLKQTIAGDLNLVSESEVKNLAQGSSTGRIKR